jgi:hypothetical protein
LLSFLAIAAKLRHIAGRRDAGGECFKPLNVKKKRILGWVGQGAKKGKKRELQGGSSLF